MEDTRLKAVLEKFSYLMENIQHDEFLRLLVEEETITEQQKYLIRKKDDSPFASHLLRRLMTTSFADFLQFLKKIKMKREVIAVLENSVEEEAESSDSRNNKDEEEEDEEKEDKEDEEGEDKEDEDDEDEGGSPEESETGAAAETPGATAPHRLQDPDNIRSEDGDQKIFDDMHATMLHEGGRYCNFTIHVTYGFLTVNDEKWPTLLKNDAGKMHMEVKVMVELMKRILSDQIKGPELVIELRTNWSPCPFCVYCILDFLQWGKKRGLKISLTIKVAALYYIIWKACEKQKCRHLSNPKSISTSTSDYHRLAIEDLFRHKVSMEAFTKEDWDFIARELRLPSMQCPYSESRQRTDCMVKESLCAIKDSSEVETLTAGIADVSVSRRPREDGHT